MNQSPIELSSTQDGYKQNSYVEGMAGGNAEFVHQSANPLLLSKYVDHGKIASMTDKTPVSESPQKSRSKRFWLIIIAIVAIVCIAIGIGAGVGIGIGRKKGDSDSPSSVTSGSPTSGSPTSSTTATATALEVRAAVYGSASVTSEAKKVLPDEHGNLEFDSNPFPFEDNMFGYTKCFSLLHQLGSDGDKDMRIFVACEDSGFYTLKAGDIELSKNTKLVPDHGLEQDGFRIFSIVWGENELRDKGIHEKLFKAALNKEVIRFDNQYFGVSADSSAPNWLPVGVVFYRPAKDRPIRALQSITNGTARFDLS
ncbi:hypothetical protein FQN50_000053 [Emmonsiellopsis sp. PD_5]|nr:hypothetical protein FQN50_000053 [Emmonsiellopsis sp. PD_5]